MYKFTSEQITYHEKWMVMLKFMNDSHEEKWTNGSCIIVDHFNLGCCMNEVGNTNWVLDNNWAANLCNMPNQLCRHYCNDASGMCVNMYGIVMSMICSSHQLCVVIIDGKPFQNTNCNHLLWRWLCCINVAVGFRRCNINFAHFSLAWFLYE